MAAWRENYNEGIALLLEIKDYDPEEFRASRRSLDTALVLAGRDPERRAKSLMGLAFLKCARAIAWEESSASDVSSNRRSLLYGIVILILAVILVSYLLRYGPQRPAAAEKVSRWVKRNQSREDDSPFSAATTSFFSLVFFALAAAALLGGLLIFMWLLALVSKPEESALEAARRNYSRGVHYMRKARAISSDEADSEIEAKVDELALLKAYSAFLKEHGQKDRAARIMPLAMKYKSRLIKER